MISSHFFTSLYMISIGTNLICCLLPYSMLTISKPLNFSMMQLETFFFISCFLLSFFITVLNFFLSSNILRRYPYSVTVLFIWKHCPSNLWWLYFSWSFSFEAFSYSSTPFLSLKLSHWSTFCFFVTNCITNCIKKWIYRRNCVTNWQTCFKVAQSFFWAMKSSNFW